MEEESAYDKESGRERGHKDIKCLEVILIQSKRDKVHPNYSKR
jgi:hypothetical protein